MGGRVSLRRRTSRMRRGAQAGVVAVFRRRASAIALAGVVCACLLGVSDAHAYVYWSDHSPGLAGSGTTVARANLDGGGVNTSFISGLSQPGGVAVDGGHMYWANGMSIGRANLDGSDANPSFIATGPVTNVAVDGTSVWWTDGSEYVGRADLDGTGIPAPHCIDAGAGSLPAGIAIASGKIYLGERSAIAQVAATCGQTPTALATISPSPAYPPLALAVAGGYVYFPAASIGKGVIDRVPTSGGTPEAYVTGLGFPTGVAIDGTYIYWADNLARQIGRAPLSNPSSPQFNFISDSAGPLEITVDARVDPTTTTVACTPASVTPASTTACKATVTDSASSEGASGIVVFSGDSTTAFIGGSSSCTLSSDGTGQMSCVVGAVPTIAGTAPITATYQGDTTHAEGQGTTSLCAGTIAQCTPNAQPPSTTTMTATATTATQTLLPQNAGCVVPKVTGESLAAAEKLIKRAGCAIGKIIRPKARKRQKLQTLIVQRTTPAAGRRVTIGTKLAILLTQKRKPARNRK